MASKIPYATSIDALLHPARNAVFFDQWNGDDINDSDLLCAEMSRLAYASEKDVRSSLAKIEFELLAFFGGENQPGNTGGTQAFIASNPTRHLTVLAFRGTQPDEPADIIADAMTFQVQSQSFPGCRIHAGFADRYEGIKGRLAAPLADREDSLFITGHSLGAALATLAALEANPTQLITFGSPLVGDSQFCKRFQGMEVHRYVDCCDVVARVPPVRFEQQQLTQLLNELGDFESLSLGASIAGKGLAEAAAGAIADVVSRIDKTLEFAHVADPIYIRSDGSLAAKISSEEIAMDQKSARAAYPHRPARQFSEFSERGFDLIRRLPDLFSRGPREGFRALIREVIGLTKPGQVPSRDLADHAPINYVSAFTGRT